MRIRTKFGLFAGLLVCLVALGISSAVFALLRRSVIDDFRREQAQQIKTFASVCQQALALSDMLFLINYLKVVKSSPGVDWAFYADNQGKILVHTDEKYFYQPISAWRGNGARGVSIELTEPVSFRNEPRGEAHIGFSVAFQGLAIKRALARALQGIAVVALGGIVLGLLAAAVLAFYMTRPIRELARGTQQIKQGQLDFSLPVRTADELGELTTQFNAMAQRLKELDALKDDFISMVSHDLRGPLGAIKMYVDYLLSEVRGPINPEQRDMLQVCGNSANKLGLFIGNILDSAKIKAGRMQYQFAPFRLGEAVEPILSLLRIGIARQRLQVSMPNLADGPVVQGDRERIEHVFANLLSNAVKHTPEGGRIQLQWRPDDRPGLLRVTLENTGRGIPKEQLEHLFERFYQADLKTQKELRIKGTGLGLSLVKETIEKHGGRIWVESEPGRITRFHFLLPLAGGRTS